jgi:hypothetical protein
VRAGDVAAEFAERSEPILRRLNETDIVNIWTYEGDNYWIDEEGILKAAPKRERPGFFTVSAQIGALVLAAVVAWS